MYVSMQNKALSFTFNDEKVKNLSKVSKNLER